MTSNATVHDLFEPVLTLAELADYLHVPVIASRMSTSNP
jgi:hypothetical protein